MVRRSLGGLTGRRFQCREFEEDDGAIEPSFKKRQRENKLREKGQLKRERRQQRQLQKKASAVLSGDGEGIRPGMNEPNSDDSGNE